MKLNFVFIFFFCLNISASVYSQQNKVTLDLKNVSLEDFINEVKEQTGLQFLYNSATIKAISNLSVKAEDEALKNVLEEILPAYNLEHEFAKGVIILKKNQSAKAEIQQKITVLKGTIVDTKGIPLPGVSVVVKGTQNGVSTDIDGKFEIKVDSKNIVLVFSFVGMRTKEVKISGDKPLNVILEDETKQLEEVVCTGFQTQERFKNSSSISTVKAEELDVVGATSVDAMVQGKLPGVIAMNVSGTPGAAPKIRIRGSATISGNREPVWVVDGVILDQPVPISAEEINSLDDINLLGNAISGLNPRDIERIDVLKDASATAIYGTKAANGVIVVTTKKGKVGRSVVNYDCNFQLGIRPSYDNFNLMNSKQRIDFSKEVLDRNLSFPKLSEGIGYEQAMIDYYNKRIDFAELNSKIKTMETMNTDWFDILYRNPLSQTHNISLSGGNEKTTYYFSGGVQDNKGAEMNVGIRNYNANMRVNTKINSKLRLDIKLSANYSKKRYNHSSLNLFNYAFGTSRTIPVVQEDGSRVFYGKTPVLKRNAKFNILNELDHSKRTIINKGINLTGNLKYGIIDGLKYDALLAISSSNTLDEEYADENTHYIAVKRGYNLDDPFSDEEQRKSLVPFGGEYKNSNTNYISYTVRNQLVFNKEFNSRHDVNVILGNEIRSSSYKGERVLNYGYYPNRGHKFTFIDPTDHIEDKYLEFLSQSRLNSLTDKLSNFVSWYGAFTYALDRKYSFNANLRIDGSNHFGVESNKNLLPIWSVSGKWSIGEEDFVDNIEWINMLDLRLSYGSQGNAVEFQTPSMLFSPQPIDEQTGEYFSKLVSWPNNYLKWEITKSYNLGIDYAFLNNRISGTFEYYRKDAKDLLLNKKISGVNGMNSMPINAGQMRNSGVELSINSVNYKNQDWKWSSSINVYRNINEVTKTFNDESEVAITEYLNGTLLQKDYPVDGFYSYKFNGLDKDGYPTFKGLLPQEGDSFTQNEYYQSILSYSGSKIPKISGGLTNNIRYKNLSLNISLSFGFGVKKRMSNLYNTNGSTIPSVTQNMSSEFINRWRVQGDEKNTNIPVISDQNIRVGTSTNTSIMVPYAITNNLWNIYNLSDLRVVSGDFVRLRTLALSYVVSKEMCKKLGVSTLRFNLQGQNLFVLASKRLNGIDPEQVGSIGMPITPNYNFGINVSF